MKRMSLVDRVARWAFLVAAAWGMAIAVDAYFGTRQMRWCVEGEDLVICTRSWLMILGPIAIGFLTLIILRKQVAIANTQTLISASQQQFQLALQLVERNTLIDNATAFMDLQLVSLRNAPEIPTARTIVYNLKQWLGTPVVMGFVPREVAHGFTLHLDEMLGRLIRMQAKSAPEGLVSDETIAFATRVHEAALEGKAGWETAFSGPLGPALPRLWRDKADAEKARREGPPLPAEEIR